MQKKRITLLKGEKFLYFLIAFLIIGNILGQSFSMALLSKTNIEVESIRSKISKQEKYNESLSMKIDELASFENVETVATTLGLGYNNSNVKVVSE